MNLVTYSAWVNLSFDLSAVADADDVREIGIKVGLAGAAPDWAGTLYVDHIDLGAASCATDTPTPSPSRTASASPTFTLTATPSPSASPSETEVPPGSTLTNTPTASPSFSASPSASVTAMDSPSSTQTPYSSPTSTRTATPPLSATSTFSATPSFSATPTFTSTTVVVPGATATSIATVGGSLGSVSQTRPVLNPQSGSILRIAANLSGVVQELEVSFYSSGYLRTLTQRVQGPWNAGWQTLALPVSELPNGVYFYKIGAFNAGQPSGLPKIGTLVILN